MLELVSNLVSLIVHPVQTLQAVLDIVLTKPGPLPPSAVLAIMENGNPAGKYGVPVVENGTTCYRNPKAKDAFVTTIDGIETLGDLIPRAAEKYPSLHCFGTRPIEQREQITDPASGRPFEKLALGPYKWETCSQVGDRVNNFASGLLNAGVKSGDMTSIYMNTCAEWQIAAHAAFSIGVVVVTVYATLGEEAMVHSFGETEVKTIITEEALLPTLRRVLKQSPGIKNIIVSGTGDKLKEGFAGDVTVTTYADLESNGKEKPNTEFTKPKPTDTAVIMYTSGSTGMPKGVILTHKSVIGGIVAVGGNLPEFSQEDVFLGFLPLAHILALTAEMFFITAGVQIGYGSPTTLTDTSPKIKPGTQGDIAALRPTVMAAVPAVIERIRAGVLSKINTSPGLVQKLFWAGFRAKQAAWPKGETTPFWDAILFKRFKHLLGGRLRGIVCGGAPLNADSQTFFQCVFGVPLVQGYGLTETCACGTIADLYDRFAAGRVGGPLQALELKLEDWEEGGYRSADKNDPNIGVARGEICIGGVILSDGYFKNPEKTAEEFRVDANGKRWFHTGDIGEVDAAGTFKIIDRKKDLVKLQMGEYVSLGKVESNLISAALVEQICVHADPMQTYCIALVVPKKDPLINAAKAAGIEKPYEELVKVPAVVKLVKQSIDEASKQAKLAKFEIPEKIVLFPDVWMPDSGLVTASMKLQRNTIYKHYAAEIKALYGN